MEEFIEKVWDDMPIIIEDIPVEPVKEDLVNSPSHYQGNRFEVIDIIDDFNLSFNTGNAIKYILRADKKGNHKQDLLKAIWYLEHELNKLNS
jgi:hypothetical protein